MNPPKPYRLVVAFGKHLGESESEVRAVVAAAERLGLAGDEAGTQAVVWQCGGGWLKLCELSPLTIRRVLSLSELVEVQVFE